MDPYSFYRYRWRHEAADGRRSKARQANRALRTASSRTFRCAARSGRQRTISDLPVACDDIESSSITSRTTCRFRMTCRSSSRSTICRGCGYPEAHPTDRVTWLERGLPKAIDRSQAILVDSDFIRHEVLTTFGIDTERVHTAYLGVSAAFMPRTSAQTAPALAPLGLSHGNYLLTVGTIEPRKNLRHVLEAFAMLPIGGARALSPRCRGRQGLALVRIGDPPAQARRSAGEVPGPRQSVSVAASLLRRGSCSRFRRSTRDSGCRPWRPWRPAFR